MTHNELVDMIRRVLLRDTNIPTEEIDNPGVSSPTRSASQNRALIAARSDSKAILLALATTGLVIVSLEPTEEMIETGARAVCRQMGHNPDGNDADCRPDHESSDGWINWFWFKNEARVAYLAMFAEKK